MEQMTPFPPEGGAQGATNTPPGHSDPGTAAEGRTDDLSGSSTLDAIRALAALLEPAAFDPHQPADPVWREVTRNVALGHAAKAIGASYRRVSVDDETAERVAEALAAADSAAGTALALSREERWAMAREAIRAIEGGAR